MKTTVVTLAALVTLLVGGFARADRVAGIAGILAAKPVAVRAVGPALQSGTVSGVRTDGAQVQIDGKWYVLMPGHSTLLRGGLPVGAGALAMGQKVTFRLASTTPGETALGVVHVP